MRYLLLIILLLLLAGCSAPKGQPGMGPAEAKLAWHTFVKRTQQASVQSHPFRITGSLRYTTPEGDSERVSSIVWGNSAAGPLRLDLTAGLGTVVAKARESSEGFLAYVPSEKTAYSHAQAGGSLESMGVPIPFSLAQLTDILTGNAGKLFLPAEASADAPPSVSRLSEQGVVFAVRRAPFSGLLELDNNGNILSWSEFSQAGWEFVFEPSSTPLKPKRVNIMHPQGYKAVITVNEVSQVQEPYGEKQLVFTIPPGTTLHKL